MMHTATKILARNGAVTSRRAPPAITFTWEWIDPDLARKYLEKNFERNRKFKKSLIERLVLALQGGYFYPVHQGIAFDESDVLIDGQNRLSAIVSSGVGAWIIVARGVKREHIEAIDTGVRRSDSDNLRITTDLDVTHKTVAIARAMNLGLARSHSGSIFTGTPLRDFLIRHAEPLDFVMQHGDRKGVSAVCRGIMAKAWYYEQKELLARFLCVMSTKIPECPVESIAVKLSTMSTDLSKGGAELRMELARKTVSALKAYLEGRVIASLYAASEDPWPLPE